MSVAELVELHSLTAIKREIARLYRAAEDDSATHARLYVERCSEIGRLLSLAKSQCPHGQWTPWVEKSLPFGVRQVQKYLKVYRDKDALVQKANSVIRISLDRLTGSESGKHGYSGSIEYYTPVYIVERVTALFGGQIDCDPASCELANTVVKARRFISKEENGLRRQWRGNIFLNPPYADGLVLPFVKKMLAELKAGRTQQACLLLPTWTETEAGQMALKASNCYVHLAGRVQFWQPSGKRGGVANAHMILYYGPHTEEFRRQFADMGIVGSNI